MDNVENRALKMGVLISSIMALAGWITFYVSGSEAMLLDGTFSFISVIAGMIALLVARKKHVRSKTFPFGSYVYEALFVFVKGILILGIVLLAATQNVIKIIDFLNGKHVEAVRINAILIYVVFITILCFILYFYYRKKNSLIENRSSILSIEAQASLLDGLLSLGIGLAFLSIMFIPEPSSVSFLKSIGDAIIVLIMCLIFLRIPFKIIKDSFIELGGGTIQNKAVKEEIENHIEESFIHGIEPQSTFISKLGSSYFIAVFISSEKGDLNMEAISLSRENALRILIPKFQNIQLEIIIK